MKFLLNLVRLLFVVQLIMGVLIWMGQGASFANAHTGLGLLFCVLVVALAVVGKAAGAPKTLTWVVILWAIVTVVVGAGQRRLLVGDTHWLIQVVHLGLGLGMAAQSERIAKAVKAKSGA
jgi:hypothetical protein